MATYTSSTRIRNLYNSDFRTSRKYSFLGYVQDKPTRFQIKFLPVGVIRHTIKILVMGL